MIRHYKKSERDGPWPLALANLDGSGVGTTSESELEGTGHGGERQQLPAPPSTRATVDLEENHHDELLVLYMTGVETIKATSPIIAEPASAVELATTTEVEVTHSPTEDSGVAALSDESEANVANPPDSESDDLDSIGVWLLTVQHLSRQASWLNWIVLKLTHVQAPGEDGAQSLPFLCTCR